MTGPQVARADGSPESTRTLDVTIGRVRLVEHTWPARARAPAEHNDAPHVCFLVEGGFEERRARRAVWRVAPHLRASPAGDAHRCAYGHRGGRCLVIEPLGTADGDVRAPDAPVFSDEPQLVELGRRILIELFTWPRPLGSASPLVIESVTLELLAQLARRRNPRAGRTPPRWVTRVREVLDASLANPPGLEVLAACAGVHRGHVARAFREHLGCTVGDYVRRGRVERARRLLRESDLPLSEIAVRAGFYDQSHMTHQVTRLLGAPPAAIRRAACAAQLRDTDA